VLEGTARPLLITRSGVASASTSSKPSRNGCPAAREAQKALLHALAGRRTPSEPRRRAPRSPLPSLIDRGRRLLHASEARRLAEVRPRRARAAVSRSEAPANRGPVSRHHDRGGHVPQTRNAGAPDPVGSVFDAVRDSPLGGGSFCPGTARSFDGSVGGRGTRVATDACSRSTPRRRLSHGRSPG